MTFAGSAWLRGLFLLAQEATTFLFCIDNQNRHQGCNRYNKKHFHGHRIAWTSESVLYSDFARTQQL
jgi:hypothetical protein